MKNLANVDLAWAAGFIDGEGSIIIYRHKYPDGHVSVKARVCASNTEKRLILGLKELFGGSVKSRVRNNKKEEYGIKTLKRIWEWEVDCIQAWKVCTLIRPYLKSKKRREAERVIELYSRRYPQRITG
jgi:hypothetical protein